MSRYALLFLLFTLPAHAQECTAESFRQKHADIGGPTTFDFLPARVRSHDEIMDDLIEVLRDQAWLLYLLGQAEMA